jgi:hypothetical protein
VRELLEGETEVVLATNGRSSAWWTSEFPALELRELPDYGVRYAAGALLVPSLLSSLPRLLRAIGRERKLVREWAAEGFDLVLSDNRYGCQAPGIRSILVTHQLRLAAPFGFGPLEGMGERGIARLCRGFDEVWIPDHDRGRNLSGRLGHPARPELFPPLRYIGPLSRMRGLPIVPDWSGPWDSVGLVSGPEPSRSDFEDLLRRSFGRMPGKHLLVRGRPDLAFGRIESEKGLVEVPHLDGASLASALRGARRIVSRGGYSTIMDLDALGRLGEHCLFVPTPGQTEQERLALELGKLGLARAMDQKTLARSLDDR